MFQSTLPVKGATLIPSGKGPRGTKFQSTLPVKGATGLGRGAFLVCLVSIHAPREGSDVPPRGLCESSLRFNPRSP